MKHLSCHFRRFLEFLLLFDPMLNSDLRNSSGAVRDDTLVISSVSIRILAVLDITVIAKSKSVFLTQGSRVFGKLTQYLV